MRLSRLHSQTARRAVRTAVNDKLTGVVPIEGGNCHFRSDFLLPVVDNSVKDITNHSYQYLMALYLVFGKSLDDY